ncbi:MAG: hypothetical protein ACKVLJ_09420 [Cytophagales bacterium]|jgi:hypothetical protein|tara:strand:+ start:13991 stop:14917 length:927 start_codon:yes stop_codon:yes gene_type:complete
MRVRNIVLLGISLLLIILNLWLFNLKPALVSLNFDPDLFMIRDTTQIEKFQFHSKILDHYFSRQEGWKINNKFPSDPNLRKMLFTVSKRVKVSRALTGNEKEQLLRRNEEMGTSVILTVDGDERSYSVVGNANKTKTYFIENQEVYQVDIPGYQDFLASIYELKRDQWRDRLVFNGNWRTIQKMEVIYPEKSDKNLLIRFKETFYEVDDLTQIDSSAVVAYLNQFEYMQANERISFGFSPAYDSLAQTPPEVIISLLDIKYKLPREIRIFPQLPGQNIRLIMDQDDELMIFESKRILPYFKSRLDFAF